MNVSFLLLEPTFEKKGVCQTSSSFRINQRAKRVANATAFLWGFSDKKWTPLSWKSDSLHAHHTPWHPHPYFSLHHIKGMLLPAMALNIGTVCVNCEVHNMDVIRRATRLQIHMKLCMEGDTKHFNLLSRPSFNTCTVLYLNIHVFCRSQGRNINLFTSCSENSSGFNQLLPGQIQIYLSLHLFHSQVLSNKLVIY